MQAPLATVIIPTFDHGRTLELAVATALAQTVPVEIFIIGDGVPPAAREMIQALTARHAQIRFFDHPKHERRGEPYRHAALAEARGRIVCYLCDRDLWLPDHVERMATLLEQADFAHSLSLHVMPDGRLHFFPVDLALAADREQMRHGANRIALSCAAHTLAFYRQLARGWETTPAGEPTDGYMFRKFHGRPDCRCVSATWPSAITFPSPPRAGMSTAQRVAELVPWQARIASASSREQMVLEILQAAIRERDHQFSKLQSWVTYLRTELDIVRRSFWWRLGGWLARVSGLRRLRAAGLLGKSRPQS